MVILVVGEQCCGRRRHPIDDGWTQHFGFGSGTGGGRRPHIVMMMMMIVVVMMIMSKGGVYQVGS